MKAETLIEKYIDLRDRRDALKKRHAAELAPYEEALAMLESALGRVLEDTGASSVKAPPGTAYKKILTSYRVADWPATLDYVRQHDRWDLLVRKVASGSLREGEQVPGVETSMIQKINVRRS